MNLPSILSGKGRLFGYLVVGAGLILASGCSVGDDTKVVDFSKTVQVARPDELATKDRYLRVAVGSMISPKETFEYYRKLLDYISNHMGKESKLIQRKTYEEINEIFAKGEIDLAFVCSGPYATEREKYGFELLATPLVKGKHFYHSYLLVNKDSNYRSLQDLKDGVFAFTDPQSNTGKLVPTYWLALIGEQPDNFFAKTIYTYSHDNSILAVAKGLVDGAAVDSLIWEYYNSNDPAFTSKTRVIKKSRPYGIPPIVVHSDADPALKDRIRSLLLSMHEDPEGQKILGELMIDRFVSPREEWYDTIRKMKVELVALLNGKPHAVTKP